MHDIREVTLVATCVILEKSKCSDSSLGLEYVPLSGGLKLQPSYNISWVLDRVESSPVRSMSPNDALIFGHWLLHRCSESWEPCGWRKVHTHTHTLSLLVLNRETFGSRAGNHLQIFSLLVSSSSAFSRCNLQRIVATHNWNLKSRTFGLPDWAGLCLIL